MIYSSEGDIERIYSHGGGNVRIDSPGGGFEGSTHLEKALKGSTLRGD